ncbi:MAG: hypothetical protein OHK0012_26770 [Synechococcales cyanobacterium]
MPKPNPNDEIAESSALPLDASQSEDDATRPEVLVFSDEASTEASMIPPLIFHEQTVDLVKQPSQAVPEVNPAKPTILLVEDDENSRFIVSVRLEKDGYQVLAAADAQQAIQFLSQHPIDLVLLDVMLPGMNGLELLYLIRAQYSSTRLPVIMITALDSNDDIVGAFGLGANDYITKPINYSVTKARIQAQVNQSFAYRHLADPQTDLLGGRYRIQKKLGQGGFSKTYLAADTQRPGDPLCVVKKLSFSKGDSESPGEFKSGLMELEYSRELFQREAQALEELGSHPCIPQLLAYFTQAYDFYLVEEYLQGQTLEEKLLHCSRLTGAEVIQFLRSVLSTLEFIHSKGVIHRDLKPSNIICVEENGHTVYKLIDFGAVKDIYQQYSKTRKVTGFIGTPGYAPPEQFMGQTRLNSDLYALGVVTLEALTGYEPHRFMQGSHGPSDDYVHEEMLSHLTDCDVRLVTVLQKMIARDPDQRYSTASEVLRDLDIMPPA